MPKSKSAYSIPGKIGKIERHIIVVWVDNEAGVLARIAGLFSFGKGLGSPGSQPGKKNLEQLQKTHTFSLNNSENLLIDLMFSSPDKKDLEKIVINKDVVLEKSEPIMIYSNKQTNQKILANKS